MSNAYRSSLASGGSAPIGDATAADVLTGKTFSGAVGSGVTGTMPNRGAVSGSATPSQPYTIPAGYHNGSGTVTASGVDFVPADKYIHMYGVQAESGNLTGSIQIASYNAYIANVSNKNTVTFNTGQVIVSGCQDTTEVLTPITITGNTPADISSYKYLLIFSNANGTMEYT